MKTLGVIIAILGALNLILNIVSIVNRAQLRKINRQIAESEREKRAVRQGYGRNAVPLDD